MVWKTWIFLMMTVWRISKTKHVFGVRDISVQIFAQLQFLWEPKSSPLVHLLLFNEKALWKRFRESFAFSFHKEAPVSLMPPKHPWNACAPNMLPCVMDWTPQTLAPGPYVSSITASLSLFPRLEESGDCWGTEANTWVWVWHIFGIENVYPQNHFFADGSYLRTD